MSREPAYTPVEPQMDAGRSTILHLVPGALATAFVFLIAPSVMRLGYPPVMALNLGIFGVLIPLEFGYLLYEGWRHVGTFTFEGIVLYRERVTWQTYAVTVPLLIGWGIACYLLLAPVDAFLAEELFSWMPGWALPMDPTQHAAEYATSALVTTYVVGLVLNGIAAPLVEELYFRGYLLPRLSRYGAAGATAVNVLLFSLYHFASPWQNVTRIVALLPLVYLVARKRNIYLSILVHCGLNTLGVVAALVEVMGG